MLGAWRLGDCRGWDASFLLHLLELEYLPIHSFVFIVHLVVVLYSLRCSSWSRFSLLAKCLSGFAATISSQK